MPTFQMALTLRNKLKLWQYVIDERVSKYLPVDKVLDDYIKKLELNFSAEELASCGYNGLAQAINTLAWDMQQHEDPDFNDVYILLQVLVTMQAGVVNLAAAQNILAFLKLFPNGASAEQFILTFHANPGIAIKDALAPLDSIKLEAVRLMNLLSANVNFDMLVEYFINQQTPAASGQDFVIGGVNSTANIKQLSGLRINGKFLSFSNLEASMRPGELSAGGFIGANDSLVKCLLQDNEFVVDELRLTHQMLAAPLLAIMYIVFNNNSIPNACREAFLFTLRGANLQVSYTGTQGFQDSPFEDNLIGKKDFVLTNLSNDKRLEFSEMVPHFISRYGFYENTSYRLEPRAILEMFADLYPEPQIHRSASREKLHKF